MTTSGPFNPLDHPTLLMSPRRLTASAWHAHVPFAMLLVDLVRPRVLVEVGTSDGDSYCAFCQAIQHLGLSTRCYGIQAPREDAGSGRDAPDDGLDLAAHHASLYGSFSCLLRGTSEEASAQFRDGAIDLLHLDGYQTYAALRREVDRWLPKLSSRGVVLLHGTHAPGHRPGVRQLWTELRARHPHFECFHGEGLGALAVGPDQPPSFRWLLEASEGDVMKLRRLFFELGRRWTLAPREVLPEGVRAALVWQETELRDVRAALAEREAELATIKATVGWRTLERYRRAMSSPLLSFVHHHLVTGVVERSRRWRRAGRTGRRSGGRG